MRVVEGIRVCRGPSGLRGLLYESHGWFARTFGRVRADSLEEGLRLWKRPSEAAYFRERDSNPSHRRAVEFLRPRVRGAVLDVGCGLGHLLRDLGGRGTGLDASFANLHLARRFVVPEADLVCADASAGLPFPDGAMDAVVSVEAFTYVADRAPLAREMRRVWNGRSGLVLTHLHRTPAPPARPVTRDDLLAWFPGAEVAEETPETWSVTCAPRGGGS